MRNISCSNQNWSILFAIGIQFKLSRLTTGASSPFFQYDENPSNVSLSCKKLTFDGLCCFRPKSHLSRIESFKTLFIYKTSFSSTHSRMHVTLSSFRKKSEIKKIPQLRSTTQKCRSLNARLKKTRNPIGRKHQCNDATYLIETIGWHVAIAFIGNVFWFRVGHAIPNGFPFLVCLPATFNLICWRTNAP